MGYKERNWIGEHVGEFKIVAHAGRWDGHHRWKGECPAGHERDFRAQDIPTTKGCCLDCRAELVALQQPLRSVWESMRTRCHNPNCAAYGDYGGRGIQVCERWDDFTNFWEDMWSSYQSGLTLDRKDNDGDYEPDNCRWATYQEQRLNTRQANLKAEFEEIARQEGVGLRAIYSRHYRNQPLTSGMNLEGVKVWQK